MFGTVTNIPKPARTMRVVLKNGYWFDSHLPDDFVLMNYVVALRSIGYIMTDELYVTLDNIQSIFTYARDTPPSPDSGVVIQFPKGPMT